MNGKNRIHAGDAAFARIVVPPPLAERPLSATDAFSALDRALQRFLGLKRLAVPGEGNRRVTLVRKTSKPAAQFTRSGRSPIQMSKEAAVALISGKHVVSAFCHFGNLRQFCWSGDRGVRKSGQQPGGLHRAAFTKVRNRFEEPGRIESGKNLVKFLRRAQSSQPDQQTKVAGRRGPRVIPQKPIVNLIDSKR